MKVRQTLIGGSRRMMIYDDMEPSEKIKVYDRGVTLSGEKASHEQLDLLPHRRHVRAGISAKEALLTEMEDSSAA